MTSYRDVTQDMPVGEGRVVTLPSLRRPWTFDDLAEIDDDWYRYEVADGALLIMSPPSLGHRRVQHHVYDQLRSQCAGRWGARMEVDVRLGSDGRTADAGIVLVEPATALTSVGYEPSDVGLLIEVVSPGSRTTDRAVKPVEYAAAGVPSFWRIETDPRVSLAAYRLVGSAYSLVLEASVGVVDLPGPVPLRIDLDALGTAEL